MAAYGHLRTRIRYKTTECLYQKVKHFGYVHAPGNLSDSSKQRQYAHPSASAKPMLPHEKDCRGKRQRDQPTRKDVKEQPSAKRRKAASHNHPPEFWNALWKITLTRRALREFDRRTAKGTTPVVRAVKRSTRLLRSDKKELPNFAKNGGPNLEHLRGYANLPQSAASMSKSSSQKGEHTRCSGMPSSPFTKKIITTGPYDPQFQQMAIQRGVYPVRYHTTKGAMPPKPENLNELRRRLSQARPSLSPSAFSNGAFRDFQDMNERATSESKALSGVVPIITGAEDIRFEMEENRLFNNFEKLGDNLMMAQPDRYHGARPEQIEERVRHDLSKYIIPSTNTTLPAAPNFFFEGKSAAGRSEVAKRQVMHDNAYGARAMLKLQNYGRETPVYDGNANSIGSIYYPGTAALLIYATYPTQSATGGTEYHMTQLKGYQMTSDIDTFRRGAAAYRNMRDFAQERRNELIANANAVARSASTDVPSGRADNMTGVSFAMADNSFGSDTSTGELDKCSSDESKQRSILPRKRVGQSRITTTARQPRQTTTAPQTRSRTHGSASVRVLLLILLLGLLLVLLFVPVFLSNQRRDAQSQLWR